MTTLNFNMDIRIENLNINPRFRLSANSDTERPTRSEQTTGQEEEQPGLASTGGPPGPPMGFSGTTTGFSGTTTGQQGIPLFSTEFSIPVNDLFPQNPEQAGFISRFEEIIRNISTTPAENNNTGLTHRGYENTQLYIHRNNMNEETEEEMCAICHGNIQDGEEVRRININSCNHRFHSACIDTWFRTRNTCPVCRTIVER